MFSPERDDDTICAVATPAGFGGISVIRVSGSQSWSLVQLLLKERMDRPTSHTVHLTYLSNLKGEDLDQVLLSYFQEGRSYTGEETVEISCHGSPVVTQAILKALLETGCRLAEPGEFTYRSFMNGRMDLVQAESVLSLIESTSDLSRKTALRQLQGELTQILSVLEDDITWCLANLEASIDFSTEDIDVSEPEKLRTKLMLSLETVSRLASSYEKGRYIQEGFRVALVGEPNVGKSSLLNAILKEDRAIVSEFAGTTRDLVEGKTLINGVTVLFVDTAGMRESVDPIEKLGIERTRKTIQDADLILLVVDLSNNSSMSGIEKILKDHGFSKETRICVVGNKKDLLNGAEEDVKAGLERAAKTWINSDLKISGFFAVSALQNDGLKEIEEQISQLIGNQYSETSAVITHARHFESLRKIERALERGLKALSSAPSPEFVAADVHQALVSLQEILGKRFDDQVMDRVFKEFCIGK